MPVKSLRPSVEPWIVGTLLNHISLYDPIWVPNCGRGDIVRELYSQGAEIAATDADLSEFDIGFCDCAQMDFLESFQCIVPEGGSIICMPPSDSMFEYVIQAFEFEEVDTIAMLMPSLVKHKHPLLFDQEVTKDFTFAYEIILTTKPHLYFYSGDPKEAKKVSKLDYSWYVWMQDVIMRPHTPIMFWEGKE